MGGYGCGSEQPNESPYMKELIVRWYQFGCFCPIFRTHGHRQGPPDVKTTGKFGPAPGHPWTESGGPNKAWSYGAVGNRISVLKYFNPRHDLYWELTKLPLPQDTQVHLEKYINLRATMKPYIAELAANVSATGVSTMRPLVLHFPNFLQDARCHSRW